MCVEGVRGRCAGALCPTPPPAFQVGKPLLSEKRALSVPPICARVRPTLPPTLPLSPCAPCPPPGTGGRYSPGRSAGGGPRARRARRRWGGPPFFFSVFSGLLLITHKCRRGARQGWVCARVKGCARAGEAVAEACARVCGEEVYERRKKIRADRPLLPFSNRFSQ